MNPDLEEAARQVNVVCPRCKKRGKVAWEGENEDSKSLNAKIRLYLTSWKNPQPKKRVVSIDYISTMTTAAAPFCVAMTAEVK